MNGFFWLLLIFVAIVLFGGAVIAAGLTVLWWVLIGLIIGGLARLLVRGTSRLGAGRTIIAGIVGSLAGGWAADYFDLGWFLQLCAAVLVAALLIGLVFAPMSSRD
jgi:uncharacterized membrane protein YeaQ/YmgE (transglycosylase-associated protein family)